MDTHEKLFKLAIGCERLSVPHGGIGIQRFGGTPLVDLWEGTTGSAILLAFSDVDDNIAAGNTLCSGKDALEHSGGRRVTGFVTLSHSTKQSQVTCNIE